jgi:glyoxylase-like metal-dependent hydrolase (beta-lactamase superfamily II)
VGYALANVIMVVGPSGDEVVLIDCLGTWAAAETVRLEFEKILGISPLPVVAIIYTHSHPDHFDASAAWVEPGVKIPIYAQSRFMEHIFATVAVKDALIYRAYFMYGDAFVETRGPDGVITNVSFFFFVKICIELKLLLISNF